MNECPICNSTMEDIHVFDSVPLSSAQLFNEFTTIEQTPMDLSICCNCNHVSNFNYPIITTEDKIEKLIEAAKESGADAVHPGYGFLSENADFAEAVINAGLTWIGPPPAAIRALGDKVSARKIASAAGAPLVAGTKDPVDKIGRAHV